MSARKGEPASLEVERALQRLEDADPARLYSFREVVAATSLPREQQRALEKAFADWLVVSDAGREHLNAAGLSFIAGWLSARRFGGAS